MFTFIGNYLSCQSGVVVCGPLFVVMRHGMLAHCNAVSFVISVIRVISLMLVVFCLLIIHSDVQKLTEYLPDIHISKTNLTKTLYLE